MKWIIILAGVMALLATGAEAQTCELFTEEQQVRLVGGIVQSKAQGEGQPWHKYMALVLDSPICFTGSLDDKITFLEAWPVPQKWLGHYVVIVGTMIAGDAWSIRIREIKDAPSSGGAQAHGCHGHLVVNRQINRYHAGAFIGEATTFEDAVKETSPSSCWFTLSDKFAKRVIAACEHAVNCEVDGVVTEGQELTSVTAIRPHR
jgi:hypothetical protein